MRAGYPGVELLFFLQGSLNYRGLKIMIVTCRKIFALTLIAVSQAVTSCARNVPKQVVLKQTDDVVCASKTDLRLVAATLKRDLSGMESALKSGADVNATVGGLGPPIVIVSLDGDGYRAVQLLLNNGANVNAADPEGFTALINASLFGHRDTASLLISSGADVNAPVHITLGGGGTGNFTPLMIAKFKGHQEIAKLLTDAGAEE